MAITFISAPLSRDHLYERETEALRIRNRYLRRLTFISRPRAAVDGDHVAVQPLDVVVVEEQATVGREHRVGDDQRDVELTLGDRQRVLEGVDQVVLAGQAHGDVLRRVVQAVVVVPERPLRLPVRVAVVLPLPRVRDVAGVPVVLRQRRRAVQVHRGPGRVPQRRVLRRKVVDEPDARLASLGGADRGPGHRPVVTPHRRLVAGEDVGQDGLHRQPVVVGGEVLPQRLEHRRDAEGNGVRRRQLALRHAVRVDLHLREGALERQCHGRTAHGGDLQCVTTSQSHDVSPLASTSTVGSPTLEKRPDRAGLYRTSGVRVGPEGFPRLPQDGGNAQEYQATIEVGFCDASTCTHEGVPFADG